MTSNNGNGTRGQLLNAILADSNDAIIVVDLKGKIKAWNKGARLMYGYTEAEAVGMTIFDMIPGGLKKQTLNGLRKSVLMEHLPSYETKRVTKDGRVLDVWITATQLTQNGKVAAIATTGRDITERNEMLFHLKELPKRIILAQEEERGRIAQEIHDDFGQSLIALKMFIDTEISSLADSDPEVKRAYKHVKNRLSAIIDNARDLSHKLFPPSLKYVGLAMAFKKLIESVSCGKDLKIKFIHKNISGVTLESNDIIIYRIAQEALLNVIKHSKATDVSIKMAYKNGAVSLQIKDNGIGFDPDRVKKGKGIGLEIMRERAGLIEGDLCVISNPGKGTTIKLVVPVKENNRR